MADQDISRYAVIASSGGAVSNIILWDGDKSNWGPGQGYTTVKLEDDQFCDIGAVYDRDKGKFNYPDDYEPPK